MNVSNAPCKDCENRSVLCHAQYEKYNEWVKTRQDINQRRRTGMDADALRRETHERFLKTLRRLKRGAKMP